jgi:hypothetical protein
VVEAGATYFDETAAAAQRAIAQAETALTDRTTRPYAQDTKPPKK